MTAIYVCPLSALDKTLAQSGARSMVSLAAPGKSIAQPKAITGDFLSLEFNDITAPQDGLVLPSSSHVAELIKFLNRWDSAYPLLLQCWMGVSRSTAAAAIALAVRKPDTDMTVIADKLRFASPSATPNARMIALADDILGLSGRLASAIEAIGRGAEIAQGAPFSLMLDEVSG